MEEGRGERELLTSLWHKTDKKAPTPDILPESVLQGPTSSTIPSSLFP